MKTIKTIIVYFFGIFYLFYSLTKKKDLPTFEKVNNRFKMKRGFILLILTFFFVCCKNKHSSKDVILASIREQINTKEQAQGEHLNFEIIKINNIIDSYSSLYERTEIQQYKNFFHAKTEFDRIYHYRANKGNKSLLNISESFIKNFNPAHCSKELEAECYKLIYHICLAFDLKKEAAIFRNRMFASFPTIEEYSTSAFKHIGLYYFKNDEFIKALNEFKKEYSYNLLIEKPSQETLGLLCNDIGLTYFELYKDDSSILYFNKAKEHLSKHQYKTEIEKEFWLKFVDGNKGKPLMGMKKTNEAIPIFKSGIKYINDYNLSEPIHQATLNELNIRLAVCYSRIGNPKKGFDLLTTLKNNEGYKYYFEELRVIAAKVGNEPMVRRCDSILDVTDKVLTEKLIEKKAETEELRLLVNKKNDSIEKENSNTLIFVSITVSFLCVVLFIFRSVSKKIKEEKDEFILSGREQEIIPLVIKGRTNKEIGIELGISENTVKYHLKKLYTKCDITSREELISQFSSTYTSTF